MTGYTDYDDQAAQFYDLLYKHYAPDIPFYTHAAKESGGKVLEIACGTGRIYLEILKAGVDAYGFDISEPMLRVLREKAAGMNLQPRVQLADMRKFDLHQWFALIIIPFRAFLHNLTIDDQLETLRNCGKHLKPGGKLMLNFFFPTPAFIANLWGKEVKTQIESIDGEVTRISKSYFTDEPNQVFEVSDSLWKDGEAFWRGKVHLALIYKREFELLLTLAGFKKWQVYGGFEYQPLTSSKQEMVWVIEK